MTNLNIAKLYLASNSTATAAQIDTAVTDGTALTAINALTTAAFVEAAYQAAFGRAADAEGLAYWSNEIDVNGMAKDDAFMTALNYGATVYVAPTAENPLVIGTETFTAATVSATDDVVVAAAKATAEAAADGTAVGASVVAMVAVVDTATAATAVTAIDAAEAAVAATGETFTLTTVDEEEVNGTVSNDTFIATTATLNTNDEIDGLTGSDVMNLEVTGATAAADVTNLETVNVSVTYFNAATAVDFTNFDDLTTVNVAQKAAGYSSAIVFTEGGAATYNFGSGMKTATFSQYDDGVVNTGDLNSLTLTAGRTANVNVESDITTNLVTGDIDYAITFASDYAVTLAPTAVLTGDVVVTGTGTLAGAIADVTGATFDAADTTLKLTTSGAFDFEDQNIAALAIHDTTAAAITNAEGQTINLTAAGTEITVDTSDENGSFTVNVTGDAADIHLGAATDELTSANVNVTATAANNNMDVITISSTTNLDVTGEAFTLTDVNEAAVTNILNLTGDSELDITAIAVTSLNAASYTGSITITDSDIATATSLTTGTGGDDITLTTSTNTSVTVSTNAGADTLDMTVYVGAANEGLYANMGADNDTIEVKSALASVASSSIVLDGGAGTDTLDLTTATAAGIVNLSAGTLAISNIEKIMVSSSDEVFNAATFDGLDTTLYGTSAASETITINSVAATKTLDMSNVLLDATLEGVTVALAATTQETTAFDATLSAGADTVTGLDTAAMMAFTIDLAAGNDQFTLSASGNDVDGVLTLGAGLDTVTLVDGASVVGTTAIDASTIVSISDFTIANDKIESAASTIGGDEIGVDVSAADATSLATDISGSAQDGVITISGTDVAVIDTLTEWINVVKAVHVAETTATNSTWAFEFDGNTYITESTATTGVELTTIELTGLTGIDALGAAVAADTIVIA